MRRGDLTIMVVAIGLGTACCGEYAVQTLGSNPGVDPNPLYQDGGGGFVSTVCPIPVVGAEGAAALTGPVAFTVQTAIEAAQEWIELQPDAGADGGTSSTPVGRPFLTVSLFDTEVSCEGNRHSLLGNKYGSDGGLGWTRYLHIELDPQSADSYLGAYAFVDAVDAGWAEGFLMSVPPDGGALQSLKIIRGEVDIQAITACSLQGTFQVTVASTEPIQYCGIPDAGDPVPCNGETPKELSGVIEPVYCR